MKIDTEQILEWLKTADSEDVEDIYKVFVRSAMEYIECVINNPILEMHYRECLDRNDLHEKISELDKMRTSRHNAMMSNLSALQRLCRMSGIEIADFDIAEKRETERGAIANAVFIWVIERLQNDGYFRAN